MESKATRIQEHRFGPALRSALLFWICKLLGTHLLDKIFLLQMVNTIKPGNFVIAGKVRQGV